MFEWSAQRWGRGDRHLNVGTHLRAGIVASYLEGKVGWEELVTSWLEGSLEKVPWQHCSNLPNGPDGWLGYHMSPAAHCYRWKSFCWCLYSTYYGVLVLLRPLNVYVCHGNYKPQIYMIAHDQWNCPAFILPGRKPHLLPESIHLPFFVTAPPS